MVSIKGKLALVTGSARGIGQQVALGLAKAGCNVIVHGRKKENAAATMELLRPLGVQTYAAGADLLQPAAIAALCQEVIAAHGGVDILYNNAAIGSPGKSIYEHTPEDWQKVFQNNLWSVIQLCNAFVPIMKQRRWGRVVNVTSGIADQPQYAPYSVSKAAIDKYTRDLATDLKGSGVLANYIDPGWIRTDLGGPGATNAVSTVLPGMLVPVLLDDDGPTGKHFAAQSHRV